LHLHLRGNRGAPESCRANRDAPTSGGRSGRRRTRAQPGSERNVVSLVAAAVAAAKDGLPVLGRLLEPLALAGDALPRGGLLELLLLLRRARARPLRPARRRRLRLLDRLRRDLLRADLVLGPALRALRLRREEHVPARRSVVRTVTR